MRAEDLAMDRAHGIYLGCRSRKSRSTALCELLRIAEPFIGRVVRSLSRGPIGALERDEALQQARIGFIDAVNRCDPTLGPLRPYAISRIRHELQTLAEISYPIKVPRRSGLPASMLRTIGSIMAKEGREPTDAELGEYAKEYAEKDLRPRVVASFDAPSNHKASDGFDNSRDLSEIFACDKQNALDALIENEESTSLKRIQVEATVLAVLDRSPQSVNAKKRLIKMNDVAIGSDALESLKEAVDAVNSARLEVVDAIAAVAGEAAEKTAALNGKLATLDASLRALGASFAPPSAPGAARGPRAPKSDAAPPAGSGYDLNLQNNILTFLRANPGSGKAAIVEGCGELATRVSAALGKMRMSTKVRAEGEKRGTVYFAI